MPGRRSLTVRLLIAAGTIGFAVSGRILLGRFSSEVVPFALTFPAVILATLLGGWLSGLVSLFGCQLLLWYFVVPPAQSFTLLSLADGMSLALVTFAQLLSILIVERFRGASENARREMAERASFFQGALREMDHRTMNNFQIAISLLNVQATQCDPEAGRELLSAAARLETISRTYNQLAPVSETLSDIRLDEYLRSLCEQLEAGLAPPGVSFRLSFDPVVIDTHRATHIGLIMNEWITNALKYAFPDRQGCVSIDLASRGGNVFLRVSDDGQGVKSERRGTGTRLARALAQSIGASVEIASENGTQCSLSLSAA